MSEKRKRVPETCVRQYQVGEKADGEDVGMLEAGLFW